MANKIHHLGISVSPEFIEVLKKVARQEERPVSQLVRRILQAWVKLNKKKYNL